MMNRPVQRKAVNGALHLMVEAVIAPLLAAHVRMIQQPPQLLLRHLHIRFLLGRAQKAIVQNIKGYGV